MKADEKPNIKDLSASEFAEFLAAAKQPTYRAKQICQWLFREHATDFATMTNLPADLREQLDKSFTIGRLAILRRQTPSDDTVKFLFGLADGRSIESVLIPEKNRLTLCISTQVGCAYGCAFCATALLGFKRNLTCGEIVEQILEAGRTLPDDRRIYQYRCHGNGRALGQLCSDLACHRNHDRRFLGVGNCAAANYLVDCRLGSANRKADGRNQRHVWRFLCTPPPRNCAAA